MRPTLEESDQFWSHFVTEESPEFRGYRSLRQAVAAADLIIRGHAVDVYGTRAPDGGSRTLVSLFAVDEVLKGEVSSRTDGGVELIRGLSGVDPDVILDLMPRDEHVIFLVNVFQAWLDGGETVHETYRYWYWLPSHQSVFSNVDAQVSIPYADDIRRAWGRERYPLEFHGRAFEEVLGQIRELVAHENPD